MVPTADIKKTLRQKLLIVKIRTEEHSGFFFYTNPKHFKITPHLHVVLACALSVQKFLQMPDHIRHIIIAFPCDSSSDDCINPRTKSADFFRAIFL